MLQLFVYAVCNARLLEVHPYRHGVQCGNRSKSVSVVYLVIHVLDISYLDIIMFAIVCK